MLGGKFNKYGTAGDVSEENAQAAFNTVMDRFKDVDFADQHMISKEDLVIRFLIKGKYDVNASSDALAKYIEWRKEKAVDNVFNEKFDPTIPKLYPCVFHGVDKEGNPIYIETPDQSNIRELMKTFTIDSLTRWHCYTQERARQRYKHLGSDRISVILDLRNIGMWILGDVKAISFLKQMSQMDQAVYPEHMRAMYIVNAPGAFTAIWKIVRPLLDERVQRKVHVLGKDFSAALSEYIEPSQLPTELGGTGGPMQALQADPSTYELPKGGAGGEAKAAAEKKE